MKMSDAFAEFEERVNEFIGRALSAYEPKRHTSDKDIRDAIWGTNTFYKWEVAILDTPLLQRLRDIHQTGFAYQVYPTAGHNRFDHTLGIVAVASRIVRSINEKYPQYKDPRISYAEHMRVRLSALLHDVGHSCFSHVSEVVYGRCDEFRLISKHVNKVYGVTPKPHEIMSWAIVRSPHFKAFITQLRDKNLFTGWDCGPDDMETIAGNIIGFRENPREKFLADIINGPMDADKLDYLVRDAYFAGPTVVYDLERFLHTVDAIEYPRHPESAGEKVIRLSIPVSGVTALEQIIISKLMLFSYLYHHHKIRCVEGMFHEALARLLIVSKDKSKRGALPTLDHPAAFLQLSDRSLFPGAWPPEVRGDKWASEVLTMIAKRQLYKRALVISRLFIDEVDTNKRVKLGFDKLLRCGDSQAEQESLRGRIFERAKKRMNSKEHKEATRDLRKRFRPEHVLVDVPRSPTIEEVVGVMIPVDWMQDEPDGKFVPLSDIFPIAKWVDAYNAIKWRGHVFALEDAVPFVNTAALEVLHNEPYWLHFSAAATDLCKISAPLPTDYELV